MAKKTDCQLIDLWRTIRKHPEIARKIVKGMDPKEVERISELWRTLRTKARKKPRR